MNKTIDIHSKGEYPANVLSNFYPNAFVFDGVKCASMEGFLQSLKFKGKKKQRKVCELTGFEAKNIGKKKWIWKISGNIYWKGEKIKRISSEFDNLINKAFTCLLSNETFVKAIKDSMNYTYTHSIGKHNKRTTVLTEEEFINVLNKTRDFINSKQ